MKIEILRRRLLLIYYMSFVLLFLASMKMWVFWNLENYLIVISLFISTLLFISCRSCFILSDNRLVSLVFLFLFFVYLSLARGEGVLRNLSLIILFSYLILLKDNYKNHLFVILLKIYATILVVSMFFFLAHYLCGLDINGEYVSYGNYDHFFRNYYFFLVFDSDFNFAFPRFQSVFVEPGHLGMISSFLIFSQSFDLKKWYNLIIMASALLSFSLAAYVLILVGACLLYCIENRDKIYIIFSTVIIVIALGFIVLQMIDKNSMFYQLIIERLQFENGDISGNNRFSLDFENSYNEKIVTAKAWLGWQPDFSVYEGGNAGYKRYIAEYGVLGILFFLLFYLIYCKRYGKYAYALCFIYCLSFLQRAYPYWPCEIISYLCGANYLYYSKNLILKRPNDN